jgi:ribose transport system substrate-binding protein
MKIRKLSIFATFAIAAITLSGCSVKANTPVESTTDASSSEEATPTADSGLTLAGKRIGIAVVGTDHDWDREAYEGIQEIVAELGGESIPVSADRDMAKMISNIENLITQQPDAIVSILGDSAALEPAFQAVVDAGIPLFTVDMATALSTNNVTSDNFLIGSTIARTLAEDMKGKGKVVVYNGFKSVGVCQIRYNMLVEVLKTYSQVTILEPELQDVVPNTVEDAKRKMTDILNKYPESEGIRAVWACWDIPLTGASQAIDEAGRSEINVYGIDGDPTALAMIQDPNSSYAATMAQQPREIGKESARNMARLLMGQEIPGTTYFAPLLANKSNVNDVMSQLGLN